MKALMRNIKIVGLVAAIALLVTSCYDREQKASGTETKSTGIEYAPQMYHAEAYEPMSQVLDKEAGLQYWPFEEVGGGESDYDSITGHGEWYNSNYYNEYSMNMRQPVPGTIARGQVVYNVPKDSLRLANLVKSPIASNEIVLADGKELYQRFCQHCHGENGDGKGLVGEKFKGVPNYHTGSKRKLSTGDIFHTITHGKGNMRAHAAQLDPDERWKIAMYIKQWQKEVLAAEATSTEE